MVQLIEGRAVMAIDTLRDELHQQIDSLPAEVLAEVADFTAIVIKRRRLGDTYVEWSEAGWVAFGLDQFLRDTDDVEYTLDDAQEIYQR